MTTPDPGLDSNTIMSINKDVFDELQKEQKENQSERKVDRVLRKVRNLRGLSKAQLSAEQYRSPEEAVSDALDMECMGLLEKTYDLLDVFRKKAQAPVIREFAKRMETGSVPVNRAGLLCRCKGLKDIFVLTTKYLERNPENDNETEELVLTVRGEHALSILPLREYVRTLDDEFCLTSNVKGD